MTQFEISATWYPLAAVTVLALVAGTLVVLRRYATVFNVAHHSPVSKSRSKRKFTFEPFTPGDGNSPNSDDQNPSRANTLHRVFRSMRRIWPPRWPRSSSAEQTEIEQAPSIFPREYIGSQQPAAKINRPLTGGSFQLTARRPSPPTWLPPY